MTNQVSLHDRKAAAGRTFDRYLRACLNQSWLQVAQAAVPYAVFFLAAHLAFIIAESFFRMAGLIGLRLRVVFLAALFAGAADFPFCLAHQAFFAAPILARAPALIVRRFPPVPDALLGRPGLRRTESVPERAAIAPLSLATCCLSSESIVWVSTKYPFLTNSSKRDNLIIYGF